MDSTDPTLPQLPGLRDHLRVLRRRWWIALIAILLVPLVAALVSIGQTKLYESSAEVLVSYSDVSGVSAAAASGEPAFSKEDADRFLATQASIARAPSIARRTLAAAGLERETPQQFLRRSSATLSPGTSILKLTVTDNDRNRAKRLGRGYARQYIAYRRRLDTGVISRTIAKINSRLKSFNSPEERRSTVYGGLVKQRDLLRTQLGLRTESAYLVGAQGVQLVQPRIGRNIAIGLGVGIVLGIALAFLLDAVDTRIRSADEIAEALGLPLLAAAPPPPRNLRADGLLMIEHPDAAEAEAFRMLRANLAFADVDGEARMIMVCSALPEEGKTTTVGNLAVALARSGRSVVVVDLDLRRPALGRKFGLKKRGLPGVTDVTLGQVPLDSALYEVALGGRARSKENGTGTLDASLRVLPAGPLPPSPGEFAASSRVGELLQELKSKADVVLVDTAPLLSVGDGLAVAAHVDALLTVSRVRVIRRRALKAMRSRLDSIAARKLGVVVTGVEGNDAAYYGYYGAYGEYASRPSKSKLATKDAPQGGAARKVRT